MEREALKARDTEPQSYTEESLKMLKTEEGQMNAVFACFGSTAQHAQMFEEGIAKFLLVYNEISFNNVSIEDLENVSDGYGKKRWDS